MNPKILIEITGDQKQQTDLKKSKTKNYHL